MKLYELLSRLGTEIPFYVYGKFFFISHLEQDGEVWVDIDPDEEMRSVRVRTDRELVDFIRSNVEQGLLFDEMVLGDVMDSIWRSIEYIYL
jgi:hypothetical protein